MILGAMLACSRVPETPTPDLEALTDALLAEGEYLEVVTCLAGAASENLAVALLALDRPLDAAGVYGQLLSGDPLTIHNLGAALHSAEKDARPVFELALSRACCEHDWFYARSLIALADYEYERGDFEHGRRIDAQAEDLIDH